MNVYKTPNTLLDNELLSTLEKLNQFGKTYIVGGHLRNLFYQKKETDVDFLTMLSLEELQSIFPRLTFTERGLEFGICRVLFRNRQFDFSLCESEDDFNEKLIQRDFTVNSLFADTQFIYYPGDSLQHLKERKLYPAYSLEEKFLSSDKLIARTFRLVGEYGFDMDEEIYLFFDKHKHTIVDTHPSMLMDEVYRMLKGEYVVKALSTIWKIFAPNEVVSFFTLKESITIPLISDNIKARLIYLDSLIQQDVVPTFLELFDIQDTFSIDFEESRLLLQDAQLIPSNAIPLYLFIKRYETNDDPKELAKFLSLLKKKK